MRVTKLLLSLIALVLSTYSLANTKVNNQKIVALAPNLVEIIYALNLEKSLVAVSEHSDYPSEAKDLPRVGNYLSVDMERIIKLNPDKIIVWQGGTPQKEITKLKQLGFTVVNFNATTAEQMIAEIKRLGAELNAKEVAENLATELLTQLNKIKLQYSNVKPLIGFIEIWAKPLTSAGRNTIVDQALQICGVQNVIRNEGTYPQVDLEWLVNQKIDVIVQPISQSKPTSLFDWSRYQQIIAVNNQAIVNLDADILLRWSPRWIYGLENTCMKIDQFGRQQG